MLFRANYTCFEKNTRIRDKSASEALPENFTGQNKSKFLIGTDYNEDLVESIETDT